MQKSKKILSVFLCICITIAGLLNFYVKAVTYPVLGEIASSSGVANVYSLPGTTGHEIDAYKNQSQWLCSLTNGTQVSVLGVETDGDNDKWYKINYGDNLENTGYAIVNRVVLKYEYVFDENFEENLKNFPESYHEPLRSLHAQYPNWKFVANNFDLTFKDAVEAQYGVDDVTKTRKWVEFTFGGNEWRDMRAYNAETDTWLVNESRWTYASRAAIEYYMDPRNSLNENMIFAFMQQSYQEDANMKDNLRTVIKGTFLEQGYDVDGNGAIEGEYEIDAYISDIMGAAQESNVSPYVLAATIIVEQGTKGQTNLISGTYPGWEGYYNFFNYSATGATADEIAVSGLTYAYNSGWNSRYAAILGGAKNYADGYIAIGQDTYYYKDFNVVKESWNHQYAAALYDAWTNAKYLQKGCTVSTDAAITFSIPVFAEMPETVCPIPSVVELPPDIPDIAYKKGDINLDSLIDIVDLAAAKMHILELRVLEGDALASADVNNDGLIDVVDLAAVKMHILGIRNIE